MAPNCATMLASPATGNGVDIVRALVKGLSGPLLITQVTIVDLSDVGRPPSKLKSPGIIVDVHSYASLLSAGRTGSVGAFVTPDAILGSIDGSRCKRRGQDNDVATDPDANTHQTGTRD